MPRVSGEPFYPFLAGPRPREPLAGRPKGPLEILLRVSGGDKAGLVLARGEVDATGDHMPEKVLERLRVRSCGGGEVRDRPPPGEEEAHHRAHLVYGARDVARGGGLDHAAPPAPAELLQSVVETRLAASPKGCEASGHRERVAGEGARLVDGPGRGDEVHHLPPPTISPDGEPAADDLPQSSEVRRHVEAFLGAAPRQPEAGHDLVEDQE